MIPLPAVGTEGERPRRRQGSPKSVSLGHGPTHSGFSICMLNEGMRAAWGPVHPQGHELCDPPDSVAHMAGTQPRMHPQRHRPVTCGITLPTHLCTLETHTYPSPETRTPTSM